MSYRIPNIPDKAYASDSGSETDDSDDNCSDWASNFGEALRTKSLFDEEVFPTPEEAIAHDKAKHGVDVKEVKEKLGLDVYGLMRLVNLIRGQSLSAQDALAIKADDERLKDDSLLKPIIADDPLLQLDFDDSWSDDEDVKATPASTQPKESTESDSRIKALEAELAKAREALQSMRSLLQDTMQEDGAAEEEVIAGPSKGKGKGKVPAGRDDDTHYFDSYAENDIHEIMLKDTTRTISYAKFILSNPQVFQGATVMDVGCGTGILSMLAARAGAKQVFAIEASGLASKARENIRKNGLDGVITVIQGKVEDIELPVKTVDVIISEWMGYMLLYESMLDSVLDARDRFLAPNGLMAPSQTRLVISGITGERVWRERVEFWKGVYGFDMTTMDSVYFNEGMVEYVDAKEIVTDEVVVRDINSHNATPKSLDFTSSFELVASESTTIRAFLTHFDTFFSPNGGFEASQLPLSHPVDIVRYGVTEYDRPVQPAAGSQEKGTEISFTTGPRGVETHWRQVVFLLREPIEVKAGDKIQGRFLCRKSATNSRELDVEIHYGLEGSKDKVAAVFKVC